MPAAEMCALARQHGIVSVVDGAHAPVMIPLSIDAIDCDFYGGNLPQMAARADRLRVSDLQRSRCSIGSNRCKSVGVIGRTQDRLDEPDEFGWTPRTRFLEHEGTRDICPWLVVPDAIDFQAAFGWDAVRRRMHELSAYCRDQFADRHGLQTDDAGRSRSARSDDGVLVAGGDSHAETLRKRHVGSTDRGDHRRMAGRTDASRFEALLHNRSRNRSTWPSLVPAMKRSALP